MCNAQLLYRHRQKKTQRISYCKSPVRIFCFFEHSLRTDVYYRRFIPKKNIFFSYFSRCCYFDVFLFIQLFSSSSSKRVPSSQMRCSCTTFISVQIVSYVFFRRRLLLHSFLEPNE